MRARQRANRVNRGVVTALVAGLVVTGATLVAPTPTAPSAAASPNELVSIAPGGSGPILQNENAIPSITGDGRIVAFTNYPDAVEGPAIAAAAAAQVDTRGSYLRDRAAPAATTAVRSLPPGFVGDTGAVISRDGCHVAFQAQGVAVGPPGVYVADRCPQAPGRRVADLGDPLRTLAISSGGRFVAWSTSDDGAPRLFVLDRSSNTQREVLVEGADPQPGFSDEAGGTVRMIFVSTRDNRSGASTAPRSNVYAWDATGFDPTNGGRYQLVSTEADPAGRRLRLSDPAVDGSGVHVAYASSACIPGGACTATAMTLADLTGGAPKALAGGANADSPSWNQDGTQLAFRRTGACQCSEVVVATDTGGSFASASLDVIASDPGNQGSFYTPQLSSTGRFLAFVAGPGRSADPAVDADNYQVFVRPRPAALTMTAANFPATAVGAPSAPVEVTVTNTGLSEVLASQIATNSAEFAVTGGTCAAGMALRPQQSCTAEVRFTPAQAGARTAQLTVAEAGFAAVSAQSALAGTGVSFALAVDPPTAAFAATTAGASSGPTTFTVTNTGSGPNPIGAVAVGGADPDDFPVDDNGCGAKTLAPGQTCTVSVRFEPASPGNRTGSLVIAGAGGSTATAGLSGQAIAPTTTSGSTTTTTAVQALLTITPPALDLGAVGVGTNASATFTVTSAGTAPTTVQTVTLTGAGAAGFTITSNGCANQVLAAGRSCTVTVSFSPAGSGPQAATLTVTGTGGASVSALLTASASFLPTVRFSPAVVTAGQVTTALGTSFPPGATVTLSFDGFAGTFAVPVQPDGTFRVPVVTMAHERAGTRTLVVADQPGAFTGVSAPLLVVTATYRPQSASGAAFDLVTRG